MTDTEANPLLDGLPLLGDLGNLDGASVLVRVDFNVPLRPCEDAPAVVTDDFRIRAALPTIEYLIDHGANVTACTHLGRPDGAPDARWDLGPVREELARLAPQVELLENLRFDRGETANDPAFVEKLVNSHDAYVNDAFGVSHRKHASVVGPPQYLPSAAGLLLQKEIDSLGKLLGTPDRPFVAVVGGAKVADKLGVLKALLHHVDALVVGGGMAFTFLAAQGIHVGKSLQEAEMHATAREILEKAKAANCKVLLPVDVVVAGEFKAGAASQVVDAGACPDDQMILDVGPRTIALYEKELAECATLVWNGPLGAFEIKPFDTGTVALAQYVARLTGEKKLLSVAGGGDTVAALEAAGVADSFSYVSTAGGAFLEWMEGKTLPGVAALIRAA